MPSKQKLLISISKTTLLLALLVLARTGANAQVWTVLAGDGKGDARDPSLADAAQFAYRYEKEQDFLWFRLAVYGIPNAQAFGVNIAFDTGDDEIAKMNWWGGNTAFKFDKLITAWVTRGDDGYHGTIGIGDPTGAKSKQFNNLLQNNLQIQVEGDSIVIALKRTDITDSLKMSLIAAVGSNERWNDDLPNIGQATIDLSPERPKQRLREMDLSRNNLEFGPDYKSLPDKQPPLITKKGRGRTTIILVPGMYSGPGSFESFIARTQFQYKIYVVTPPGINGTRARAMPRAGSSFSELAWTRQLERDLLNLIRKEKATRPIIVAEQQPASLAAMELAIEHPNEIGGVVLSGTGLVAFFPSSKDPTGRTPATFQQRIEAVDEGLASKWFKYVTPETWNSNDLQANLLSANPSVAREAWEQIEAAPLQVKIRYVCEYWASDVSRNFDRLQVPVLVLVPGFDEKFLADPVNSFAKFSIVNAWEAQMFKHPKLEIVKIPDARLLLLEDQPQRATDAIAAFVEKVGKVKKQN